MDSGMQGAFDFDDEEEERLEQEENLERVSSRIGRAIIDFCQTHRRFHADELRAYAVAETGIAAPASADRILRDLRLRGVIDYVVVNRRASLYEVIKVNLTEGCKW
jgi:hypothetical protein